MEKKYTRREFLYKQLVGSTVFLGGGWLFVSCKSTSPVAQTGTSENIQSGPQTMAQKTPQTTTQNAPNPASQATPGTASASKIEPCDDLTGVAPGEIEKRKKFAYVNVSPIPDSKCENCKLFIPGKDKTCGGCMLFKGPVRASGYCTYWAPIE